MSKKLKCVFVFAHPDDAEITSFGTIKTFLALNYDVTVIIVTSGTNGISVFEKEKNGIHLLEDHIRREETANAFKDMDLTVTFLDIPHERVCFNFEIVNILEKILHQLNPDILVTHFLDNTGNDHQEHTEISNIVTNISNRLVDLKLFMLAEPIKSFKCQFIPNYFIDVTEFFEEKCRSLDCHHSQKNRFYFDRKFHLLKCRKNALSFNSTAFTNGRLYESFQIIKSALI